ncbi:MAG: type II toxin-antitoxin system Phd/YefM family antitoxin [Syntrophobacteraceae bacterium]
MKELVTIREANQHLSRYVDAVQEGAEITITRRGVPVAKLIGVQQSRELTEAQQQARKRTLARMRKGYSLGGRMPRRDALHER